MADDDNSEIRRGEKGRFAPGSTGNKKGRGANKVQKSASDSAPSRALDQEVLVTLNGKKRKTTVRERMALQLAKSALDGDKKALKMLLDWEKASRAEKQTQEALATVYPLAEEDDRTIKAICERIRSTKP